MTVAAKRRVVRTCLYCEREYTCWNFSDEPDGLCSEKCEKALESLYSTPAEEDGQQAWDTLQAVPAYTARHQRYHARLAAFFQAVAMQASQEVDPFCLDWEEANEWRELQDAWEQEGTSNAHV